MKSGICPKCQSQKIIPNVQILDYFETLAKNALRVAVYENPDALFFKGEHKDTLTAWICGDCGYAELYVGRAQALNAAYQASRLGTGRAHVQVASEAATWTCPNCNEEVEHQFDFCWNCGFDQSGGLPDQLESET